MNDEWLPAGWRQGVSVMRPEMMVRLYDDGMVRAEPEKETTDESVELARKAEEAFYARMEKEAEVRALKAQMEREMEIRRRELEEASYYDDNPAFGAF